jgi:photosystem II stability/assembly factor-like uncharacterized protein
MGQRVLLLVGTKKGVFILESDEMRRDWSLRGPLCEGWPMQDVMLDPATDTMYAGGGSEWYGPAVWRSTDLGETWTHSSQGLTYGDDGPKLQTVWSVQPAHGALYAGVQPAGLFRSDDDGATWRHVEGLTQHPSRPSWQPGAGGLILHTIVPDRHDAARMWVAISAVGTFATEDGGDTWEARNRGVLADFMPDPYPETGQCVHKLAMAAAVDGSPDRLYQQNHCGVYRSDDAGHSWERLDENGLPSRFGFPLVVHPRDRDTFLVIPLNGDDRGRYMPDGQGQVWRTRDGGSSWQRLSTGLPQEDAYLAVLREAMGIDRLDPAGVYFGTSTGQLWASSDEGDTWRSITTTLPPIWSVDVAVLD